MSNHILDSLGYNRRAGKSAMYGMGTQKLSKIPSTFVDVPHLDGSVTRYTRDEWQRILKQEEEKKMAHNHNPFAAWDAALLRLQTGGVKQRNGFEFRTSSRAISLTEISEDLIREEPAAYVVLQDENDYTKLYRWVVVHSSIKKKADLHGITYAGEATVLRNGAWALQVDETSNKEYALDFVRRIRNLKWDSKFAGNYKVRVDFLTDEDLENI